MIPTSRWGPAEQATLAHEVEHALGIAFIGGAGNGPAHCDSFTAWYDAAFPDATDAPAPGAALARTDPDQSAVITCGGDEVRLGIAPTSQPPKPPPLTAIASHPMADARTFVIVGASLAGAKAAETLREEGFEGRVVLIGEEDDLPYERPPLSKDYLRGEAGPPFVHDEAWYAEHEVDLRQGVTVSALDVDARTVSTADGEGLGYDALLLTTGAEPHRLTVPGMDLEGVRTLRSRADSDRLRDAIRAASSVALVGAGWIGAEVAASARQLGATVTLMDIYGAPLELVLGPTIAGVYRDLHEANGVTYLGDAQVAALEGDGTVQAVRLADDRTIEADLVVVGIGVAPRTRLAEEAGLAVDDGVLVDAALRTSRDGVYAAGDVASAEHPFYGRRIRVEHWANALNQGPAAARSMLGQDVSYDRLPYFYSDQFDLGMEYVGLAEPDDRVVVRGDLAAREFIAFWLRDGRVVAGMNANVWDVIEDLRALILSRAVVDESQLADSEVALQSLAG